MAIPVVLTSSRMFADENTLPSSTNGAPMKFLAVKRRLQQCLHKLNTQLGPHNTNNYNTDPSLSAQRTQNGELLRALTLPLR